MNQSEMSAINRSETFMSRGETNHEMVSILLFEPPLRFLRHVHALVFERVVAILWDDF